MNVTEVCRAWRDVALASPRLWCSFDLSDPNRALILLKRSKPAPLHIGCGTTPLVITEEHEDMTKWIMAEVHRIQVLDLFTRKPDCILRILSLNGTASAPLLQRLRLKSLASPNATSMPPDILRRKMPSLHRLELEDFYFSPGLPPLPHLTYLKISLSLSTMTPSSLLTSLWYATNLKEIDIAGLAKDDSSDLTTTRVQLPNLVRISITSNHIESAAIFANLEYPPSTMVAFTSRRVATTNPNLSSLSNICGRFHEISALAIHRIELNNRYPAPFRLDIWGPGSESSALLSISLALGFRDHTVACMMLCSALPLESVPTLGIQGFHQMACVDWAAIFRRCEQVAHLRFTDVLAPPFRALLQSTESPHVDLPVLQNIHLVMCTNPDPSFDNFVKQRKHLGVPIQSVTIESCSLAEGTIDNLSKYTNVDWDGKESISEDEEEKEDDSEDEYDFECGFGAF